MAPRESHSSISKKFSKRYRDLRRRLAKRQLQLETLEERRLLAIGPALAAIEPNDGLLLQDGDSRGTEIVQLTFRFEEGQQIDPNTLSGIQVTALGNPLDPNDDVVVQPGFIGVEKAPENHIVTMRFAQPLEDGLFQIDVTGSGPNALRNLQGEPFNNAQNFRLRFEMDLGAKIISVVPQPIDRRSDGTLAQRANQIELFFNEELDPIAAANPSFYRLIFTANTADNTDGITESGVEKPYLPTGVNYSFDAATGISKATLTFSAPLDQLPGLPPGTKTFRLRVGTDESAPLPPAQVGLQIDAVSDFNSAGRVLIRLAADVAAAESYGSSPRLFVNQADLGTALRTSIRVVDNRVFLTLNSNPAAPATAQHVIDAINGSSQASALMTALIVGGTSTNRPGVVLSNQVINYSPIVLKGLGSSFNTATDLNVFDIRRRDTHSKLLTAAIDPQRNLLDFPGASDEPGHRELPVDAGGHSEQHVDPRFGGDADLGVTTILYNFKPIIGQSPSGETLENFITERQKQRIREALEMWSNKLGIEFLETKSDGVTFATGDPLALDPYAPDVVNYALQKPDPDMDFIVRTDPAFVRSMLILDAARDWETNFGDDYYQTAMIGIGFVLGMQRAGDLPEPTTMAFGNSIDFPFANAPENITPGNQDIVHGQYMYRPDSNDIDLYRFRVDLDDAVGPPKTARLSIETFAERRPNASSLDTLVTLYREVEVRDNAGQVVGTRREVIARNDDYYSEDSFIEVEVSTGNYFVQVTASGNSSTNLDDESTGFGGTSQGTYELRIDLRPTVDGNHILRDRDNVAENQPGTPIDGNADGTPGGVYNFWFRVAPSSEAIFVDRAHTQQTGTGAPRLGSLANPFNTIRSALAAAQPGSVVRIVGNGGGDKNPLTISDNLAYEIGLGTLDNQVLRDGATMEIPRNVTVMVDSGAILKLRESRIAVGSSTLTIDRSAGALQILGTPLQPVYMTSWLDESIGRDFHQPTTTPASGDWGGISFRADLDNAEARFNYENQGIFLNYVNHADIRYGGGQLTIDSVEQVVQPVQMIESRPTITENTITFSADTAMSADPNSFRETNFHAPRFQLFNRFTSDYQRVGPEIHGNLLVNNSTNGLFVSILTPAGDELRRLTVPGRFDDTDIVHVLTENLEIQGTPGAPLLDTARPPVNLVGLSSLSGGSLPASSFTYKVVFFDANGFEGRPSEATGAVQLAAGQGSVRLTNIPPVSGDYIGRRVYRSSPGGGGPYRLIAELQGSDTAFTDNGSVQGPLLQNDPLSVRSTTLATVAGGTLSGGVYNYRVTYVDSNGVEGPASDATANITIGNSGNTVRLTSLPTRAGLERRIYRSGPGGTIPYTLVGEIPASQSTVTTFTDTGSALPAELDLARLGVVRARNDARLRIDPGIVVKLESARIEATFGSQFIAEGREDRPVIFTSTQDDRYGAGGTFDTGNDGAANQALPGDWGGVFIGQSAEASIDYALLTYGGGDTRIEGTFVHFNVLEVHQAHVRLAHSLIENNADGVEAIDNIDTDRVGRGLNEPATIFMRATQAVLLDNVIRDNQAQAMTIDVNSFTHHLVNDPGRSTGLIDASDHGDNHGPLVRGNIVQDNPNNGMTIRGGILTSKAVFDDTDIAHVLFDEIIIPNFHTYGGLRIQSSPSASLVMKFGGGNRTTFDPRQLSSDSFQPHRNGPTATSIDLVSIEDGLAGVYRRAYLATVAQNVTRLTNLDGSIVYNVAPTARFGASSFAPTAGITATGTPLDIDDRIGGVLQIVGQPDFPVILTSFHDDTLGAGFKLNGQVQRDTNSNGTATVPQPGDWRSLRLEPYSHDRNVAVIVERESPRAEAPGVNATPDKAQFVGQLAANERDGDDNLRLGFEVNGLLNAPADVDVYSFTAQAGTEVWLDIDRTSFSLNSVVELIDAAGNVIARSDDSLRELEDPDLLFHSATLDDSSIRPIQKAPLVFQPRHVSGLPKDHFSLNPLDAGMRLILPGVAGTRSIYHVRVRSFSPDIEDVSAGQTEGVYQLQIRLRELDEFAGSTVQHAEVRYAMNGIEVIGLPGHSPLLGEATEDEQAGGPETNNHVKPNYFIPGSGPQNLGNIMATDRAVVSIAGRLTVPEDVDFFQFHVSYPGTANNPLVDAIPVVFDLDYADGLSRPNTNISVFDSFGRLVLFAEDSNIADDRLLPLANGDLSELSNGSAGPLDPFIGPVVLPEGTYFVAVSSSAFVPGQLLINPAVRREPINSIQRLVEDHLNSTERGTANPPHVTSFLVDSAIDPLPADRVSFFVIQDVEGSEDESDLAAYNPFTGQLKWQHTNYDGNVEDITTRITGGVYGFSTPDQDPAPNDASTGLLRGVNTSAAQFVGSHDDGILTFHENPRNPGLPVRSDVGIRFNAAAYGTINGQEVLLAVGDRGDKQLAPPGPDGHANILYRLDPNTGRGISAPQQERTGLRLLDGAGTNVVERGILNTNVSGGPGGTINGIQIVKGVVYVLTDTGGLFVVNDPLGLAGGATLTYVRDILPPNFPTDRFGVIHEIEPNDDPVLAPQDLDREIWTQRQDDNILNSTTVKHITIQNATGDHGFLEKFVENDVDGFASLDGNVSGLVAPRGMVEGPDGHIYVTSFDAATDISQVLRFHGQTGELMGAFVPQNAGGLRLPSGLAFLPDGDLLVSSRATNQILQYDGTTGLFERIFTDQNLSEPNGLAISPRFDDVVSDFNTGGLVQIRFQDRTLATSGSTEIEVRKANLGTNPALRVTVAVAANRITLTLNSNPSAPALARHIVDAVNAHAQASQLVEARIDGGFAPLPENVNVSSTNINFSPLVLSRNVYVANAGSALITRYLLDGRPHAAEGQFAAVYGNVGEPAGLVYSNRYDDAYHDFNTGRAVFLRFEDLTGAARIATEIFVSSASLPTSTAVQVRVVGDNIFLTLNSNPMREATAQDVVNAINNDPLAKQLVRASIFDGLDPNPGAVVVANRGLVEPIALTRNLYVNSFDRDSVDRLQGAAQPAPGTALPGPEALMLNTAEFVVGGTAGLTDPSLGIHFDADGLLYVTSEGTDQVLRFDEFGLPVGTGEFIRRDLGGLDEPSDLVMRAGEVLVVSPNTDPTIHSPDPTAKILRYDRQGNFIDSLAPAEAGGLDDPRDAVFGPDGHLYVTSAAFSDSVLRYHGTTGEFMGAFVADGSGGLDNPFGLAFGPGGDLFVASQNTNRILRYDGVTGAFEGVFASGAAQPRGITFDSLNRLYVSSLSNDSVLRYDRNGIFQGFFVPRGIGGLDDPAGLSFGPDGNLYVASEGSDQVLRYNGVTGAFIDAVVNAPAGFDAPMDVQFVTIAAGTPNLKFMQPGRYMFVTSSGTDRVFRFNPTTGALIDTFVPSRNEGLNRPVGMAARTGGVAGELFVVSGDTDEVFRYEVDSRASFDYYKFSVDQDGSEVVIDIDFAGDEGGSPDTVMMLVEEGIFNDDFSRFAGGAGSATSFDAILGGDAPLVLDAGTYVVVIAEFDAYNGIPKGQDPGEVTNPLDRNDTYTLHISMTQRDDSADAAVVVRDFEGLAARPRQTGGFENVLFAIDTFGDVYSLSVDPNNPHNPARNGIPTPFFRGDDPFVLATGADHARGLALSDTFLHLTQSRHADAGHGVPEAFDNSRGDGVVYLDEIEPNNTFGSAHDLELERWSLGYDSNIGDDTEPVPVNTSTFLPHVTITGTGHGSILDGTASRDFYSFEVTEANSYVQFEIDYSFVNQLRANRGQPGNFPDDASFPYGSGLPDAQIRLFDSQGNLLGVSAPTTLIIVGDGAYSLDPAPGSKSSNTNDPDNPGDTHEAYLESTLPPGRYVIEVTKFDPELLQRFLPLEEGDEYTLQISVQGHPVPPAADKVDGGASYFFGTSYGGRVFNATATDPVQITSPGHGLIDGQLVYVEDVRGIRLANGTYEVTVVDDDTFELVDADGTGDPVTVDAYEGGGTWRLIQMPEDMRASITSESFSLAGYAAEDNPIFYFNYLANLDLAASAESFDIYIIVDGGPPQKLLGKTDLDIVTGTAADTNPVAPAPRDLWRQARIELDQFAGKANLQIRFEFDTRDLIASDFEGVFIDDFVIGFAERGEMISNAYNDPLLVRVPGTPSNQVLAGEYQLEMRRASSYGVSQHTGDRGAASANSFELTQTYDTNARFAQQISLVPPRGADIDEGDLFTIGDGNRTVTFEFDADGSSEFPGAGNALVSFTSSDTADQVAARIIAVINGDAVQSRIKVQAGRGGLGRVHLFGAPLVEGIAAEVYRGDGDVNRFRDQGQVLITSNFVTNSRDFGIVADAAPRLRNSGAPYSIFEPLPGAARNLQLLNSSPTGGLARGVTIENNVLTGGGLGGIHLSGDSGVWELVTPRPLDYPDQFGNDTSGDAIIDGASFIIEAYGMSVRFEFEDISGDNAPAGSDADGGNGWTPGSVPIFYRRSDDYLLLRDTGYSQTEMVYAIREAINSSILVTNGTSHTVKATPYFSRRIGTELLGSDPALYLEGVSRVIGGPFIVNRRVPLQQTPQPFARVVNNTVYGHDGTEAFFAGSAVNEPNDVISQAVQTFQGTANIPATYTDTATIGDSLSTIADRSLDVDFYQIQLAIGDRVVIDLDANETGGTLDSVLRIFNSQGVEVAANDNSPSPGEQRSFDSYLDFTATEAGTYYVGVSAADNDIYSAMSLGGRQASRTRGDYTIEIDVKAARHFVIETVNGSLVPDGTTIQVSDRNRTVTFELDLVNSPPVAVGNIPIRYDGSVVPAGAVRGPGYLAPEMAVVIADAITAEFPGTILARALGGLQGQSSGGPVANLPTNLDYNNRNFGHDYDPNRIGYGQISTSGPFATGERFVVIEGASRIVLGANAPFILSPDPNGTNNSDQVIPERGILLSERTSATLLNNVLANLTAGVLQTDSPTTIMGGSLFQNNVSNHNISALNESFTIVLPPTAPLFVNAADGNFYPAPLSRAIDSSIDSLEDRDGIVALTQPLKISPSPILAPDFDVTGQLRVDDPDVSPPDGFGANVFKDRGGLDRADFTGPDATLINPQDNDALGVDKDPQTTVVRLNLDELEHISIQIVDGSRINQSDRGSGVDDASVTSDKVTITRNGQLLIDGQDYTFDYDPLGNIVRLTHISGIWPINSVYVVQLNNTNRFVFTAPDGSQVRDGEVVTIGDADGRTVTLEFESGFSVFVPEPLTLHVPVFGAVAPRGVTDGQRFRVLRPFNAPLTFEYDVNVPPNVLPGSVRIDISSAVTAADIAQATVLALQQAGIGLNPRLLPGDNTSVHLGAGPGVVIDTQLTNVTQSGRAAMVVDGNIILVNDGIRTIPFEFEDQNINNGVAPGAVPILFTHAMTRDELATRISNTIAAANLRFTPANFGEGHVHLGGNPGATLDLGPNPTLKVFGNPGVQPSTQLHLPGRLSLQIPAEAGGPRGVADGQFFTISDGSTTETFEFEDAAIGDGVAAGNIAVTFTQQDTVEDLAATLIAAIRSVNLGLVPDYAGNGLIQLNAGLNHTVNTTRTRLTQTGKEGGVTDGETFVITDGTLVETFEFDSDNSSQVGNRRIQFVPGSAPGVIADAIIAAIRLTSLGLNPVNLGQGVVALNDTPFHGADVSGSSLVKVGVPGGAVPIAFFPDESLTPFAFAQRIIDAIEASELNGVRVSLRGGDTYFVDGAVSLSGALQSFFNGPIEDLADNDLQPNQPTNETLFTILTPGIGVDFGDAPDPTYPTLLDNDGARHVVLPDGLHLGSDTSSDADGQPTANADGDTSDDGVVFNGVYTEFISMTVTASAAGLLDAWIDFNRDGDWNDPGEQIMRNEPLVAGDNPLVIRPTANVGETYARFRISSAGDLLPTGIAADGEVEDYRINIKEGAPPTTVEDRYSVSEDAQLNVASPGVLQNDSNWTGVESADGTSQLGAIVTVNSDGSFVYDPRNAPPLQSAPLGGSITDTFTYRAGNEVEPGVILFSEPTAVTVTVTGRNDAPVANGGSTVAREDGAPVTDIFAGDDIDTDDDQSTLTYELLSQPSEGSLADNGDGTFTFNPGGAFQDLALDELREVTFRYRATDSHGATSAPGTGTITVTGVNDGPTVSRLLISATEDGGSVVGTFAGDDVDSDDDRNSLTYTLLTQPTEGTLTNNGDGTFTFNPGNAFQDLPAGATRDVVAEYTARDSHGAFSSVATITIRVTGVNDAPTAVNDPTTQAAYATNEDTALTVSLISDSVLANDSDIDTNDTLSIANAPLTVTSANGAQVVLNANGTFVYDPRNAAAVQALNIAQSMNDTFEYTVTDGRGGFAVGTVTVAVSGRNDRPTANRVVVSAVEDGPAVQGTFNGDDLDQEDSASTLTYALVPFSGPAEGSVTNNGNGTFTFNPGTAFQNLRPGQVRSVTVQYTATDRRGSTSTPGLITIQVTGKNDAPVAIDDKAVNEFEKSVIIDVLANDQDVDSSPFDVASVEITQTPANGSVVVNANGTVTYTANPGFRGPDSFRYRFKDLEGADSIVSNTAKVDVVTTNFPVANGTSVTTFENTPININVMSLASDADGTINPKSIQIVSPPTNGVATPNDNGTITYTPNSGFLGNDQFQYTIKDNNGAASRPATINVSVIENPVPYRNARNNLDVNADGAVTPFDALLVISFLNRNGSRPPFGPAPPFLDTSPTDNFITPSDAVAIISHLMARARGERESAEGESGFEPYSIDVSSAVDLASFPNSQVGAEPSAAAPPSQPRVRSMALRPTHASLLINAREAEFEELLDALASDRDDVDDGRSEEQALIDEALLSLTLESESLRKRG